LIKKAGTDSAWRLVCLFLWAAQNRPDGVLSGMSAEDIELAVDWTGEDGSLVNALISVGFIEEENGEFIIHDWHEHNPWAAGAGERKQKAQFNALCKHYGREEAARRMPEYVEKHAKTNDKQAVSTDVADSVSATSMHAAETSTAPSLTPSLTPSPSTSNSVTNVTGDESPKPLTPDEIIFGYGLPLLTSAGTADKQARSFLGGLRKAHGDTALIDKLRDCIKAKPLQPLEWLAAALPPAGSSSPRKTPAPENFATKDYGTGGRL
jgi:hypothetical protein